MDTKGKTGHELFCFVRHSTVTPSGPPAAARATRDESMRRLPAGCGASTWRAARRSLTRGPLGTPVVGTSLEAPPHGLRFQDALESDSFRCSCPGAPKPLHVFANAAAGAQRSPTPGGGVGGFPWVRLGGADPNDVLPQNQRPDSRRVPPSQSPGRRRPPWNPSASQINSWGPIPPELRCPQDPEKVESLYAPRLCARCLGCG